MKPLPKLKILYIPKTNLSQDQMKVEISRETTLAVKEKHKKWKKYLVNKNSKTYEEYKQARNDATREIRRTRYTKKKLIAGDIKNNPKNFWKCINNETKSNSNVMTLEVDGIQITEETEIAENLNNYFCTVFTKEESVIPEPDITTSCEITDIVIEENILAKVIKEKYSNKAQGPDEIHPRLLIECQKSFVKLLTPIYKKIAG